MSLGSYWEPPEYPCAVCEKDTDACECPECPKCGVVGDPDCYRWHGLKPEGGSDAEEEATADGEGVAGEGEEVGPG